jgi:hypothetical protein
MSYNSATNCVDHFSRLQIGVMLWTLQHVKTNTYNGWSNTRSTFDSYEPDNDAITGRNIQANEIQERNFHQQWNRFLGVNSISQCDVDWVRFSPTCSNPFDIETFENIGRTNANTRLTLFDANLNQLAQNDDISISNEFSKISYALVSGQTYFFRIENLSSNITGYYNLRVSAGFILSGNSTICNSETYAVNNLPTGAVVTWSASPSGIVNFSPPTGSSTSVIRQGSGTISIIANIASTCGNISIIKQNVVVGSLQPGPITFSLIDPATGKLFANIQPVAGATSYNWYMNGTLNSSWTGPSAHFSIQRDRCDVEYDISVAAVNSCGTSLPLHRNAYVPCDNYFMVSPNPATTTINISTDESKTLKALSVKTIDEIRIYDNLGNLKKYQTFNKVKTASLNISSLPPGTYFIEISNGTFKERKQLIILK